MSQGVTEPGDGVRGEGLERQGYELGVVKRESGHPLRPAPFSKEVPMSRSHLGDPPRKQESAKRPAP